MAISGEHRYEKKAEDKGIFRTEFRYGKFSRVIPLPVAVQNDQVKADFSNGILTLILLKVEAVKNLVVKVNLAASVETTPAIEASNEQAVNSESNDVWETETAEPAADRSPHPKGWGYLNQACGGRLTAFFAAMKHIKF